MRRPLPVGLLLFALLPVALSGAACSSGVNKTIPLGDMAGTVDDFARPRRKSDLAGWRSRRHERMTRRPSLDLASDVGGPTIVINAPVADADVPYNFMTVTVTVTAAAGAIVDGSTVLVQIPPLKSGGMATATSLSLIASGQYSGPVDITAVPPGAAEFVVIASDTMGRQTSVEGTYVHDPGPVITFIQPTAPTAHGSVNLDFLVTDTVHPVVAANVTAGIRSGSDITLTQTPSTNPLEFTGLITFTSYTPALDGNQLITVQATNSAGVVGKAVKPFTVDNQGPVITFVNPVAGAFVGGVLNIQANISDISGVNPSSVLAIFGGDSMTATTLTLEAGSTALYSGLFDVRKLPPNYALPIFSIRAADTLGNISELGEEIIVDNTPPRLELDPGSMRVGTTVAGIGVECSQLFDPVGGDAANDGTIVPQIITLRARVEDRGNDPPGLAVERISGIDPTSVTLYAIPAGGKALAVDTDGDGNCDDVNPNLVPTDNLVQASNQAVAVALTPIPVSGTADFSPPISPNPSPFSDPGYDALCQEYGASGTMTPLPLCLDAGLKAPNGTPYLTIALPYTAAAVPAIWTIPPVLSTPDQCLGLQFDSLNRLPEGPTCIAVRAQDAVGNTNISPPLLVCVDHGGGGCATAPPKGLDDVPGHLQQSDDDRQQHGVCADVALRHQQLPPPAVTHDASQASMARTMAICGALFSSNAVLS